MFAMLVHDKEPPGEIASSLNDEQIRRFMHERPADPDLEHKTGTQM
jgi:hypothetical protein